jgi:hypothetical protein
VAKQGQPALLTICVFSPFIATPNTIVNIPIYHANQMHMLIFER